MGRFTFTSEQKIGDIVAKFPGAGEIFKAYKIDFCCGGDKSLIEAIMKQGLDETEVLSKLNEQFEVVQAQFAAAEISWVDAPLAELVEFIIHRHHGYLYENLPKLSQLTSMILKVHGATHPELSKVFKLFHTIKMELDEHLIKEETIQYPAIREYLATGAAADLDKAIAVIQELEDEHAGAGDILKELRKVTGDYAIPEGVCGTFELTYTKLKELESDLFEHIHLENNILFPRLYNMKKQSIEK